ncbi:MAG: rod shape-determining protein [Candidatus Coatesbacteria bacterium]|nr:rod shape-determining protein [Candidatus Coatesbacteria bacterium]
MFQWLFSFFSNDLAIDLGTANSLIYMKNRGIVLSEPSIVAIQQDTKKVLAVGKEARRMVGRTPENILAIRPLQDGVISDFDVTEKMLRHFISKVHGGGAISRPFIRPRVIVAVPSGITQVMRKAVIESATKAGAAEVYLVEEPMAAAIGAGLPIDEPFGNMIVDIGGGTTEVAVISLAGMVFKQSLKMGGDKMDDNVQQYIKKKHNLLVGQRMSEYVKIQVGSAYPLQHQLTVEIQGRDIVRGVPKRITVSDEEIREALKGTVDQIVQLIRQALEKTPPELSGDIAERGLTLSGGGSLLRNLDLRLRDETGLPIKIAEDPLTAVALGAGRMLNDINLLRKVASMSR